MKMGESILAPNTSVLPYFLKIWTIDFRSILLSDVQVRSILHLTPPTSCVFLLLDLKSMVQILRKHGSMDILGA
jgi:hypothetical protein